jgi:hypothetical protein
MAAVVARRPPWYRRIFGRQRAVAAGERPGHMGRGGRSARSSVGRLLLVALLILLVVAPFAGYALVPQFRSTVDDVIDELRFTFMSTPGEAHPIGTGAGVDGQPAQLATDTNTATYWLADPASGVPTLTAVFEGRVNLSGLVFHSGSHPATDFTEHRRPRTVELRFPGTQISPVTLELKDEFEAQSYPVDAREISQLQIVIRDTHGPARNGGNLVALREVEFKVRR